jgi:hypothetical protein
MLLQKIEKTGVPCASEAVPYDIEFGDTVALAPSE